MNYISSEEIAQKWSISTRRVRTLCKNGQIEEAALIGNAWMIPANAEKPIDKRTKSGKEKQSVDRIYLFFNPTYVDNANPYAITEDDRRYCEIMKKAYTGNIKEAEKELNAFVKSCDKDYLLMAYITLVTIDLDLNKKAAYLVHTQKTRSMLDSEKYPFSGLFLKLFHGEKVDIFRYNIPKEYVPLITYIKIKADICNNTIKSDDFSSDAISVYELAITNVDNYETPVLSTYLHCILAVVYSLMGNDEACDIHQRKATEIALKHRFYTCIAEYGFMLDWSFIKEIDEEAYSIINELSNKIVSNYIKIGMFSDLFSEHSTRDLNVIKTAFLYAKGKSQEEIGSILDKTPYYVKKYLEEVYRLTGLNNREDIAKQIINNITFI